MLKLRNFFAKRYVKIAFGLLLIVGGIVVYAFFDRFSYFPFLLILIGIIGIVFSFVNLKTTLFYLLLFFLLYMLFPPLHEVYKHYHLTINIPKNSKKVYFIASNNSLKWKDYLLTWFTGKEIQADLSDKTVIHWKRGIPNHIRFNWKDIYDKGYSTSIVFGKSGRYKYIVLMPLNNKITDRDIEKLDKENYSDSHYGMLNYQDAELNRETRQHKVDSLENSYSF